MNIGWSHRTVLGWRGSAGLFRRMRLALIPTVCLALVVPLATPASASPIPGGADSYGGYARFNTPGADVLGSIYLDETQSETGATCDLYGQDIRDVVGVGSASEDYLENEIVHATSRLNNHGWQSLYNWQLPTIEQYSNNKAWFLLHFNPGGAGQCADIFTANVGGRKLAGANGFMRAMAGAVGGAVTAILLTVALVAAANAIAPGLGEHPVVLSFIACIAGVISTYVGGAIAGASRTSTSWAALGACIAGVSAGLTGKINAVMQWFTANRNVAGVTSVLGASGANLVPADLDFDAETELYMYYGNGGA